jgi:ribosomal protein L16/L10AE
VVTVSPLRNFSQPNRFNATFLRSFRTPERRALMRPEKVRPAVQMREGRGLGRRVKLDPVAPDKVMELDRAEGHGLDFAVGDFRRAATKLPLTTRWSIART